jgi:hypothetical protein
MATIIATLGKPLADAFRLSRHTGVARARAIALGLAALLPALLPLAAAKAQTSALELMERMSFQLQESDSAQFYARIQERGGGNASTMEFLGTYKVVMSHASTTRPNTKKFVVMFNTSDIRHSSVTLPREDQKMILAIFSDIAILLDEDLRGEKVLNWDAVTERFERFKTYAAQRSKLDALKLTLFGALYMQEDFWKSMLDAVFELQKSRWVAQNGKFYMDVSRKTPGNMLVTKSSRLSGRREIVPTGIEQGKVSAKTSTTYDASELVKSLEDSPLGKLLQGAAKGAESKFKMTIAMRSDGVIIYNPNDGWVEHYAERLLISSDAGGKTSERDVIIQFRQKRLGP